MTRVDFYHLQNQKLEEVLPKLLEKSYEGKKATIIKVGKEEKLEFIDSYLWSYSDTSFLPHGTKKDTNAALQPIFLTTDDQNPNSAKFLFLVDGAKVEISNIFTFERIFYIIDGSNDENIAQAREFWRELKSSDIEVFYWQKDAKGAWQQKG